MCPYRGEKCTRSCLALPASAVCVLTTQTSETQRQRFRSGSQQPSSPHENCHSHWNPMHRNLVLTDYSASSITSTTGDLEMQGFIHGAIATKMRPLDSKRIGHVHSKSARSKQGMFLLSRARKLLLESCKVWATEQDGALGKKENSCPKRN